MKKILMTLAAVGLVLTGCTKNEVEDYGIPDPDVIGFSPFTSRAVIANLATLTGDAGGFRVYGKLANVNNAWHTNVDGLNNYAFNLNWGWKNTPAEWPTIESAYPMEFYAMYPDEEPITATPGSSLTGEIEIAPTAATQIDLLGAKATADSKPASGQLSMTFNHILSKINIGIVAGHDMTVEIQSVDVRNVHGKNTYNYMTESWGTTTNTLASYNYFRNTTAPFVTTGSQNEDTAVPFYVDNPLIADKADSAHLMLMPQSVTGTNAPAAWNKTAGATLSSQAYLEVIYRITNASGDYIGYTEGAKYLTDYDNATNPTWGDYFGLGTADGYYNGHLYVKVGFPITLDWSPRKGYTYNIYLGTADSTNGYYTDPTYYDENGSDTGIPVIGPDKETPVVPGDPVTSGIINFLIVVANWDNSPGAAPLK